MARPVRLPPEHPSDYGVAMTTRVRKLIGTILLLAMVAVYALIATAVAGVVLPESSKLAELAFYAMAGLAWVLPAGLLIRWMHR